jgi:phage shock protein C
MAMSLSDELARLDELHQRGALNDDEFARAKSRTLAGVASTPSAAKINSLRRSNTDRWIAGVCGGIGQATGIAGWIWRMAFVAFSLCGGAGLLLYVLFWIFVPRDPLPSAAPAVPQAT